MKGKWIFKIDALSARKWYILLAVYFVFLLVRGDCYIIFSVGDFVGTHLYRYLQFYPGILIIMLTADLFEETFRREAKLYLQSFGLSVFRIILGRVARLFLGIAVLYVPMLLYSIPRLNDSLAAFYQMFPSMFPSDKMLPMVGYAVPLVHCLVIVLFLICATMFVQFIAESKSISVMFLFSFLAFDVLVSRNYFAPYNIFRGAFDPPELYVLCTPNILVAIVAIPVFLSTICLRYRSGK